MEPFNPEDFLILVVDDISQNLQVIGDLLDKAGYSTTFASNGKQAITRVKAANPDLIMLDLMMPEMNGLQVCKQLQADSKYCDIPIIFLTASHESEPVIEAFTLGAVDYVTKPFNAPELLARVKTHLTLKKTRDELKNTLADLVEAREAALASAQLKSQFLANMSHEIRTPMNAVLGMAELLLTTDLNAQQIDFVKTLKESGDNLLAIINDILDFSKLEAGEMRLNMQPFNLTNLMENLHSLFLAQAQDKGLKMDCHIAANVPINLRGDELRLRQILTNLVSNAIKFTESGTVAISVECESNGPLEFYPQSVVLRFTIEDTGIGISARDVEKLFKSFSQVDGTATRQYGGTGLGLAICKQLVQLMEGEIGVCSQFGEGSAFWFSVKLSLEKINLNLSSNPEGYRKNNEGVSLNKSPILLVEDTRVNQKVIRHQLQLLGYKCDCTNNGREALEKLADNQYKLVLMDCNMPVLNGYDTTKMIRERAGDPQDIVIIGLTAYAMPGDREKCLAAGMNDYLSKPVSLENLSEALSKWLP